MSRDLERNRFVLLVLAATSLSVGMSGCGDSMSSSDMRRYAIRRPSDDEEAPPPHTPLATPSKRSARSRQPATSEPTTKTSLTDTVQDHTATEQHGKYASGKTPSREARAADQTADATAAPPPAAPKVSLSEKDRLKRSAENLETIAAAIQAYLQTKNVFPPAASYDAAGTPLLSWRVLLLPYLGHEELYKQFRLNEPWYTPHNKQLIDKIPAVFQSPERWDSKTNYLAVVGGSAAFDPGRKNGVHPRRFDDGVENTVLLVETDDEAGVTWTQPSEYEFDPTRPAENLGQLRSGYFFVVWGSGLVGMAPTSAPPNRLAAMYSRDGGEQFAFSMINRPVEMAIDGLGASAQSAPPARKAVPQPDKTASDGVSSATTREGAASGQADHGRRSGLAKDYYTSAASSYASGNFPDAMRWWYAAAIADPAAADWHEQYDWAPGLRRPRPAVPIAVGVDYSGRHPSNRRSRRSVPKRTAPRLMAQSWSTINRENEVLVTELTAPFGDALLPLVEVHAHEVSAKRLGFRAEPPVTALGHRTRRRDQMLQTIYVGEGRSSELIRKAVDEACEVLLLFEVRDSATAVSRKVSFRLIDLERREDIAESPQLAWRATGATTPLEERKDFREALWQLRDTLRDELSLQPWPSQIQQRHAVARVQQLADMQTLSPLVRLAEMTVYRNRRLINDEQLLAGYRAAIGEEAGIALLLGSHEKKRRILRKWLPTSLPSLQQREEVIADGDD